jgi:uncharacterized protein YkwD
MKQQFYILIMLAMLIVAGNPKSVNAEDNATKDARLNTAANASYMNSLEKEIVYEINLFRSNPASYAINYIAPLKKYYKGKIIDYGKGVRIQTHEGVKAVNECVSVLKKAKAQPLMHPNKALYLAARDHQQDQSKTGKTGHIGSDGSNVQKRIERYGKWDIRIAENIAYGNTTAREIVIALLIDDGVKNRGHRKNMLHPDFTLIGVATGKHPVYRSICVMDFAGEMTNKRGN